MPALEAMLLVADVPIWFSARVYDPGICVLFLVLLLMIFISDCLPSRSGCRSSVLMGIPS
nr:MAG TPA: hypothetical protein [Siphoviridae sp. ctHdl3]